jgi:hypothetical protein
VAGIALILRYQWRAFVRRFVRTRRRAQYYLTMLAALGWSFFVILPPWLSRASHQLAAGQTTVMEAVLWVFCGLWLLVPAEDASVSLASRRLLTFPIDVGSLLGVRVLSLFCSPVTVLIALGSLMSLWPFFSARHPVLGGAGALLLFALAFGLGMTVSLMLSVAGLRRKLLAAVAIIGVALGAFFFAQGLRGLEQLRAGVAFTPPHLVTSVAVAATPSATFMPLITLLAIGVPVGSLLLWSFRHHLFRQTTRRAEGRAAGSVLWFPGRFGGLLRKEQHYFRRLLDLWVGLLLASAISVASLFGSLSPFVRQSTILIVFALNVQVVMNCFGMDTTTELNRYSIFPLRGKDVLLVKNLGLTVIVAAQLALLILSAAWRSGPMEAGAETIEAAVLLLSHLAWGNIASVEAPFKMRFYRFSSSDAPITALLGVSIGSVPGVMVLVLLRSGSLSSALGIPAILLLVVAAYLASLHYAGRSFEHRRQIIGERLS